MQEYISSHPVRIDKFKLALWNLIQWDSAGHQPYIPDNGRVEPWGIEDPDEVGSLGWIQDWCIRSTFVKDFYKYDLRRRKETSRYNRRRSLASLYKIEDAEDYPYCSNCFKDSTYRPWSVYVKTFVDKRRIEREFWFSLGLDPGPTKYPTNQEVIDVLLQASQFTSEASPEVRVASLQWASPN
jgi:hypothetical protein